ncbi:uncharacterized protein [Halyomorpha halys]|uniref:uncharacterized protein n=1 Tax=Halyomorpha halys TaxID=286706 RepID=UPI0006D527A6|nr:uncharacterized protein LOC106681021 [Halyomorpha halys]
MSVLPFVVAIVFNSLRCVHCDVLKEYEANYFSSYVPRDYRNPMAEGVSVDDLEMYKNEKKDGTAKEEINNEFLSQFSNSNVSQQFKKALLNDYYLGKPYTRGDASNLYNLDLLSSGLIDFNKRKKSNVWLPRPNYRWLNGNISWPIIWHRQFPRSDSFLNLNSSNYNLCNDHISHSTMKGKRLVIAQPSIEKTLDFNSGINKVVINGSSESKDLLDKVTKDFIKQTGNKFDNASLQLSNNSAVADSFVMLQNLISTIEKHLPSLSEIFVTQSENNLTKLFNSFNTSSLLDKYENS